MDINVHGIVDVATERRITALEKKVKRLSIVHNRLAFLVIFSGTAMLYWKWFKKLSEAEKTEEKRDD